MKIKILMPGLFALIFSLGVNARLPGEGYFIVLNSNDDSVSLIDPKTYKEVRRFHIGKGPHHLLPTPDDAHVIIGNTMANELVIMHPKNGNIIKRIKNIADPYHFGFSPDGKYFVVNGNRMNHVDVYHYKSLEFGHVTKKTLFYTPSHMAFDNKNVVYVTLQDSDRLVAIDLATMKEKWFVSTGRTPAGVWVTPNQEHVLVGNTSADYVDVFRASDGAHIKKIKTGKGAHNFLPKGDGIHVYISNRVNNTISIIDQNKLNVIKTFKVPGGPDDMELRSDASELWVTSRWRNRVSVVDTNTYKVMRTIKVGRSPHGLYYHKHAARN